MRFSRVTRLTLSIAQKLCFGLLQLFLIRHVLGELGFDQYQLFGILTGITAWYMVAEGGVGYIAQRIQIEKNNQNIVKKINGVYIILILYCLFITLLIFPFAKQYFLRTLSSPHLANDSVILISLYGGFINAFSSSYIKVLYAQNRVVQAHVLQLLSYCLIYFLVISNPGMNFATLITIYFYVQIIPIYCWIICSGVQFNGLSELFSRVRINDYCKYAATAALAAFVTQADILYLSGSIAAEDFATYTIFLKVVSLFFLISVSVLSLYLPEVTRLLENNENLEVEILLGHLKKFGYISCISYFTTIFLFKDYLEAILNVELNEMQYLYLTVGFCFLTSLRIRTSILLLVLNARTETSFLFKISAFEAGFIAVTFSVLIPAFGPIGAVISMIVAHACIVNPQYSTKVRRVLE